MGVVNVTRLRDRQCVEDDADTEQNQHHAYEAGVGPARTMAGKPEATDPGETHHDGD